MELTRFGATGLSVSRLCLGTMTFGDQLDEKGSHEVLDVAWEHGVNLYDTANTYNAGKSEEILGRWIKARGLRERIILTSKVGYAIGGDPSTAGSTPKVIVRELEASLRRLQTEYLDIYLLHLPDDDTPVGITLRCLDALVSAGKVRYIGLSNFAAWQIVEAIEITRRNGWTQPLITQFMYNTIARGPEQELLPMTRKYDIGNMVYNPLAGGLLTGKHRPNKEASDGTRLASNETYRQRYWHPRQREAAEQLRQIAENSDRTAVELSLRFLLDSPHATTVLLGATHREQLEQSLKAMEASPLSEDERRACDEAWWQLHGPVPRYHRSSADPSTEPLKARDK